MAEAHVRVALALAALPGVGRRRLRLLLARAAGLRIGSPGELEEFVTRRAADVKLRLASPGVWDQAWRKAYELARVCRRRRWRIWALGAPDFPSRLARLDDPPALLFVHGQDQPAERTRLAVIGTREPSPWGLETAGLSAAAAARAGSIVVSGLAWGIDTAAHEAVVAQGGCTWAVLPASLDIIFPPSNAALATRIVEAGGALISEYFPGTRPHPTFFVERDRLQAALSDVVLVIETGLAGGTMHTVRFARELGLPLHVTWPSNIDLAAVARVEDLPETQQGPWTLIRAGARRVSSEEVPSVLEALDAGRSRVHAAEPAADQGRLFHR